MSSLVFAYEFDIRLELGKSFGAKIVLLDRDHRHVEYWVDGSTTSCVLRLFVLTPPPSPPKKKNLSPPNPSSHNTNVAEVYII
jgi:hypothetical protein